MCAFDLNGDGVDELITGWSNGRLDVRDVNTGRVIYREKLSDAVVALKRCDFRGDGVDHLVCCTMSGEVRGILPVECDSDVLRIASIDKMNEEKKDVDESKRKRKKLKIKQKESSRDVFSNREDEATIERLMQEKQSLSLELRSLASSSSGVSVKASKVKAVDFDESTSISIDVRRGEKDVILRIETKNESCVIRYVELQEEQTGDTIVSCPRKPLCT